MVIQDIKFSEKISENSSIVVGVYSDGSLSSKAMELDADLNITSKVKKLDFCGCLFKTSSFVSCSDKINHVILIGLGEKSKKYMGFELEKLGANIYDV